MGVIVKQSAYASIINYIGVLIGAFTTLIVFPKFLTQEEYGLFRALISMALILSPFAQLGLPRSTLRYFPRFNNRGPKAAGRFLTFILILGFFTILTFILIFQLIDQWVFGFFEKNAPELVHQYWLIISLAGILVYISIFESYYKARLNVVIPAFIREFFLKASSGLLAFLYFLDVISFEWFLRYVILSYAVSLAILILILFIKKQLHFNFSIFQLEKPFVKEMLKYMLFIMAGAVGSVIVLQIDQLMVTAYLGTSYNAVYVIAFFMGTVIEIPKRSISQMSDAIIASAFENERLDEVKKLYKQSSINQLILGGFVFVLVIVNLDNIYSIMPNGDQYLDGKLVAIIIGLGKLCSMAFGVNSEIIVSSKYYKSNIYFVLVLAVLTVVLNAFFIPRYGLEGAALATFCSIFLFNLIKLAFIYNKLYFQPFSIHSLSTVFIIATTYFTIALLPRIDQPFLNALYLSAFCIVIFGTLMLIFRPSKEISGIINPIIKRFKK